MPLGLLACLVVVSVTTVAIVPLRGVAPVVSLGVTYLLGVLLVSGFWGVRLGALTAAISALAFNYFHIPPTGKLTIQESENWVALLVFLLVALVAGVIADGWRTATVEAEKRRQEANLAAELAQVILGTDDLSAALAPSAQRIAQATGLASAGLHLGVAEPGPTEMAIPIGGSGAALGTLVVKARITSEQRARLERFVVPTLHALLGASKGREDAPLPSCDRCSTRSPRKARPRSPWPATRRCWASSSCVMWSRRECASGSTGCGRWASAQSWSQATTH